MKIKHVPTILKVLPFILVAIVGFLFNTEAEDGFANDDVSVLENPTRASVTDITSIVSSASSKSYSPSGHGIYRQLQGFTLTNNHLVFYTVPEGTGTETTTGRLSAFSGSNFSTAMSGTPFGRTYDHGNDMTYNSNSNKVLVVGRNNYKDVKILNGSTLADETTKSFSSGVWAIGYDEFHNYYVLLQDKFYLADSNFNKLHSFNFSLDGNISQGIEYHNGYVYYATTDTSNNDNIFVYNAKLKTDGSEEIGFGDRVANLKIRNHGELESVSFHNDEVYLGFVSSGNSNFYHFAASKIAVPLGVTVDYQDAIHSTTVKITGAAQLQARNGYKLSSDGYVLSKTINSGSISGSEEVCDNYNNCKTVMLSHTNSDYTELLDQTVSFANSLSSIVLDYGTEFTNKATSSAENATIIYTSSNEAVATVDNNGKLTIKKSGIATITAKSVADGYVDATDSYDLTVQYVLSFDNNGGNSNIVNQKCVLAKSANSCAVVIPDVVPTRDDYFFLGWAEDKDATIGTSEVADEIALSGNKTLYAIWVNGDIVWTQGQQYTLGSGKDAVFKVDYPYNYFESLSIDDEVVSEDNYDLVKGSTIITLHADYLNTLSEGDHKAIVAYNDGMKFQTTFTVVKEAINTPDTGSSTKEESITYDQYLINVVIITIILVIVYCIVHCVKMRRKIQF